MKNPRVTFNFFDKGDNSPVSYKEITCHLIFDVKIDIARNPRYVSGGHIIDTTFYMTYTSVVIRDNMHLAFLIATLNDLDLLAGDNQNAYLNALTKEKVFSTLEMNRNMTKEKFLLLLDLSIV